MKLNDYLEAAKKENEKKEIILDKNEEKEKDNKKIKKIKEVQYKNYKSTNASPIGMKRKKNSQTCRDKNLPFIFKGSSDSEEDKKSLDNKPKNHDKTKKHKKEDDKLSPKKRKYYSTKLLKVLKRKNRKYTVELNSNHMQIKSPKKTSPGKTRRHSAKKVNDKNKKFINE